MAGRNDKDTLKPLGIMEWLAKISQKRCKPQEYDLRSKGVNDTGTGSDKLMKELVYRIVYM